MFFHFGIIKETMKAGWAETLGFVYSSRRGRHWGATKILLESFIKGHKGHEDLTSAPAELANGKLLLGFAPVR